MVKIYYYLKDLIFLYRASKDISLVKRNHYEFISAVFNLSRQKRYKRKYIRGLLYPIIKQLRTVSPYRIQNYRKAELLYKEYFTLENHIPSFEYLKELVKKEEVWVIGFRAEYPVKGEKFSEYYTNYSGHSKFAFKLSVKLTKYESLKSDPYVNDFGHTVNEEEITRFKFATKEEIQQSKDRVKALEEIQKEIDSKQKELNKLYGKKSKL